MNRVLEDLKDAWKDLSEYPDAGLVIIIGGAYLMLIVGGFLYLITN
jgi:hypothetical protein